MTEPYHKYVWDFANRKLIGAFEEMYQNEEKEGFDSWHQNDMSTPYKQRSLEILSERAFPRVLDIGCGSGIFTACLRTSGNEVIGTDIAPTVIKKAREKYPEIDFRALTADEALALPGTFDLVVMMEILSLCENWRELIEKASAKTVYVYISLYMPRDPIGYVKSFAELKQTLYTYFTPITEEMIGADELLVLAKRKR